MQSVSEIIKSNRSGYISFKGYFYVLGGKNIKVFVTDNAELEHNNPMIVLSPNIANIVMSLDDILGVLVGGIYLYYSVPIEILGNIRFSQEDVYFENVSKLVLFNEHIKQEVIVK